MVRLNITIDEDVHKRLKEHVPAKGMSRFINDAIRARLRPSRAELEAGYKAMAQDAASQAEAADWDAIDLENWPE